MIMTISPERLQLTPTKRRRRRTTTITIAATGRTGRRRSNRRKRRWRRTASTMRRRRRRRTWRRTWTWSDASVPDIAIDSIAIDSNHHRRYGIKSTCISHKELSERFLLTTV